MFELLQVSEILLMLLTLKVELEPAPVADGLLDEALGLDAELVAEDGFAVAELDAPMLP